ncbi:hypothetical protein ACFFK0_16835 [Paenibacillus chartarius]|uniref:Nucleotide exchange factor GrpE n=1 Tax=Paenibacillus chartarius TaxID=747481 RepID=A0ABV6DN73_9BACL
MANQEQQKTKPQNMKVVNPQLAQAPGEGALETAYEQAEQQAGPIASVQEEDVL